jgi:cytochrome c553
VRTAVAILILFSVLIAPGIAQTASRPLDGEALYRKHKCPICHGIDGSVAVRDGYPVLSGQNKTYLINQTIDIRDGVRDNGQARLMRPLTLRLTRAEIEKIADYLSRQ